MLRDVKLEWGNPKHIGMVRSYDEIMRGEKPVVLRVGLQYAREVEVEDIDDEFLTTYEYIRCGEIKTPYQHCIVKCPCCQREKDIVFGDEDEKEWCYCGLEFEIRKQYDIYQQKEVEKVFVKQEEVV